MASSVTAVASCLSSFERKSETSMSLAHVQVYVEMARVARFASHSPPLAEDSRQLGAVPSRSFHSEGPGEPFIHQAAMKKQVHVPLCAFLLLCGHLTAQPVQWIKHWGGSDSVSGSGHSGLALTTGLNGRIYGTGRLGRSIGFDGHFLTKSGDDDILVLCWDSLGNTLWARNYGAATTNDQSGGYFEEGREIAYDPINQRVIIGGEYHDAFTIGNDTLPGTMDTKRRFFITAVNGSGQPVWSRSAVGNNLAELRIWQRTQPVMYSLSASSAAFPHSMATSRIICHRAALRPSCLLQEICCMHAGR